MSKMQKMNAGIEIGKFSSCEESGVKGEQLKLKDFGRDR